jgi:hypothetical protein
MRSETLELPLLPVTSKTLMTDETLPLSASGHADLQELREAGGSLKGSSLEACAAKYCSDVPVCSSATQNPSVGCLCCSRELGIAFGIGEHQRNKLLCISECSFDDDVEAHLRMLQVIQSSITGAGGDSERYGKHWETVGWQGEDPATDLRACGLLGLLLPIAMLCDHFDLACAIHRQSRTETTATSMPNGTHFPMMATSMTFTLECKQQLRAGTLNALINCQGEVHQVITDFFSAMWFVFLKHVHADPSKLLPEVLPKVITAARKAPLRMIRGFKREISRPEVRARYLKGTPLKITNPTAMDPL